MNNAKLLKRLLLIFAAVTLGSQPSAFASSDTRDAQNFTVYVSYADLNLASDAGVSALYRRLYGAARSVCSAQDSLRDAGSLEQWLKNKQCFNKVLTATIARFDNPRLKRIHAG